MSSLLRPLRRRGKSRAKAKTKAQGPGTLQIIVAHKWNAGLAVVTALLAVPAFTSAFVQVHSRSAPELALRLAPQDSVALASKAERLIGARLPVAGSDFAPIRKEVDRLATRALRSEALNPRAVRLLAYNAMLSGDYKRSVELSNLAVRLTRRDVWVYLLRIEDAVRRNDLADVLRNYDRAMTVGTRAGDLLSPLLVNGLSDPAIRSALIPYVIRNPDWMNGFLLYAVGNTKDPQYIADLIVRSGGLLPGPNADGIRNALMPLLFDTAHFSALDGFFRVAHGDPAILTMADFSDRARDARFAPVAWQLLRAPDLSAEWDGEGDRRRLLASIGAGKRAVAARKLLSLKPGYYKVFYRFSRVDADAASEAIWSLYCRREGEVEGRLIWQSAGLSQTQTGARRSYATIPASCALQELRLTITGGESQYGMEVVADPVVMRQVN